MLERNVAGLEACVPVPLGLGAQAGETTMAYYPGAAAMSGLYVDPERDRALVRIALLNAGFSPPEAERRLGGLDEVRQLRVRLTTVSDFVREHAIERVDLLKIDVERAEPDVLAGVGEVDWPRIRQVAIEVHDEGWTRRADCRRTRAARLHGGARPGRRHARHRRPDGLCHPPNRA